MQLKTVIACFEKLNVHIKIGEKIQREEEEEEEGEQEEEEEEEEEEKEE